MKKPTSSYPIVSLLLTVALLFVHVLHAQINTQQLWLTYNQQARLSTKWGYLFDVNYRTIDFKQFQSTLSAVRAGATYFLTDQTRISAGYAWFGTHLHNSDTNLLQENRLWQQILWQKKYNQVMLSHRIRVEERFREAFTDAEKVTNYSTRFRYMVQIQVPIVAPKSPQSFALYAQAADEIMLHTGEETGTSYFNQNRIVAGVSLSPSRQFELALLYQYIAQYQPSLHEIVNIHSIRITLLHQLDFRKR
jgi:hypothetical protein